jgi:hypothetical protein
VLEKRAEFRAAIDALERATDGDARRVLRAREALDAAILERLAAALGVASTYSTGCGNCPDPSGRSRRRVAN